MRISGFRNQRYHILVGVINFELKGRKSEQFFSLFFLYTYNLLFIRILSVTKRTSIYILDTRNPR